MKVCCVLIWGILCGSVTGLSGYGSNEGTNTCEPITITLCQNLKYNVTRMPGFLGHKSQDEADEEIMSYKPLVDTGCNENVRFFLCSLFAPMCSPDVSVTIPSCKSICLKVMDDCLPALQSIGVPWPPKLNCSRLPIPSESLCMEPKDSGEGNSGSVGTFQPTSHAGFDWRNRNWGSHSTMIGEPPTSHAGFDWRNRNWGSHSTMIGEPVDSRCPPNYIPVRLSFAPFTCVPRCGADAVYYEKDKEFAEVWMTILASLCLASTAFTVATFLIDVDRFQYPERAVVFLSLCLGAQASAYLLRAILGPERVSCDAAGAAVVRGGAGTSGVAENSCVVVFLLSYYFGTAASAWWVVLTVTWFLAAGRKWSSESIKRLAPHFHVAAWTVPAALCVVVVAWEQVEGDELTGMCVVGGGAAVLGLVIVPLVAFFCAGAAFIITGFSALVRIRRALKRRNRASADNVAKLETLMVKILVFSAFYAIPALGVIGCTVFEWRHADIWSKQALRHSRDCADAHRLPRVDFRHCWRENHGGAQISIPMMRLFMSLVVGITPGMWMWSFKTWASWKHWVTTRLCCRVRSGGGGGGGVKSGGLRDGFELRRTPLVQTGAAGVDPRLKLTGV
ncbi:unnamed protein product [Notodromas monacha]|uniref:Frizzled-4 n=1 Tax=Notodromas monacha TaxID=399045 RepID=A0A7R9BML7_9CRUS|nr:unnamed protein product [Notodromas monacha]CAG0916792.1 unnamed protein product [Notodromas monacha]